jgi:hypothetical protein
MNKAAVKRMGKRYRVVDAEVGVPLYHAEHGYPLDGGGHMLRSVARRQAQHINRWNSKKARKAT